jgi:uncharacterized protein YndB with AHSA1/START domain
MSAETTIADGIVTKDETGADVIHFERRLSHPIERVWAALTEPDELIRWWGEAEVELVVGGRFKLRWLNTDEEGNSVEMDAEITELESPRRLEIAGLWYSGGPDGDRVDEKQTSLRWELESDRDSTVLRFWNALGLSDKERTQVPAGWHFHLDALATVLDGGSVDIADPWQSSERIHRAYVDRQS